MEESEIDESKIEDSEIDESEIDESKSEIDGSEDDESGNNKYEAVPDPGGVRRRQSAVDVQHQLLSLERDCPRIQHHSQYPPSSEIDFEAGSVIGKNERMTHVPK
eukprot:m.280715 g.280715  ORF g.280715 m.280715 type:complete len:105 (+) comp17736_c0_seq19:1107-1421(+)